jgi:hypothetical protein
MSVPLGPYHADNLAPYVAIAIPDQDALPDWPFNFTVAPGSIADPDAGDPITCEAVVRVCMCVLVCLVVLVCLRLPSVAHVV